MLADMLFNTKVVVAPAETFRCHATIYVDGYIPETETVDVMTEGGRQNAADEAKNMLLMLCPHASVVQMGDVECLS